MGLENLKSAFNDIASNSQQIGGRHGGLTGETPSQPPHQDWHSLLDDINPYTNQFVFGYQYKNPNKGGIHGANIDFDGTPVLSTPTTFTLNPLEFTADIVISTFGENPDPAR